MPGKWTEYAKRPHFFGEGANPSIYYKALSGLSGTYVDIGAGDGAKLKHALEGGWLSPFHKVLAFDISEDRIRRLREHVPAVTAEVANALALPLADGSVDFAYADQVIEHVDDDRAMAREVARILAFSGRAVIGSVVKKRGAWYFYRCNGAWRLDPTHLREYRSLDKYGAVFRDAGLEVLELVETPLRFSAGDLLLRALLRVHALRPDRALDLKQRVPIVAWLARVSLRVPRYYTCHAVVRREGPTSGHRG